MKINTNKKLPMKGRKVSTNINEFVLQLDIIYNKHKNLYNFTDVMNKHEDILYILLNSHININKDSSISFDLENIICDWDTKFSKSINKYHMRLIDIDNKKVPIIFGYAGGDWEYPVHFIIYLDDKYNVRMYVPKCGNTYNALTKEALGNDEDMDTQFLLNQSKLYNVPNINIEDIDADVNLMLLDIKSRLIAC